MSRKTSEGHRRVSARQVLAGFTVAAIMAACSTTQQAAVSDKSTTYCPFLGSALCAKLTANEIPGRFSGEAAIPLAGLRWVNPNAQWTQYTKIMIAPGTFWAGDNSSVSAADQQALTNYFYNALNTALAKKFQIVDQPGPGVMEIQVAIDDVETATPVLRSVSMVVPQARALATLKYLATGTYAFVGGAQAEAKVTDSLTGQVLVAAVDKRVGGGSLKTAAQWQWGDAENAMDAWSQQAADRLSSWTSGTAPS